MIERRLREVFSAIGHPRPAVATSVRVMHVETPGRVSVAPPMWLLVMLSSARPQLANADPNSTIAASEVADLVVHLFESEGQALVRLARLFVDDRNAAEDLVQEAFIRLARAAHRIEDVERAPAYLRSIVLNLARDHNRRGLVSLRHQLPFDDARAATEDVIDLREDQAEVVAALRNLPRRQRDCLVLRYYDECSVGEIADLLSISPNSVKTHLKRGLQGLRDQIESSAFDEAEVGS